MERYRKILVAVDGSESSKNAFRQACRIAREDKSWITAITAIPLYQDQFEVLSTKEKVSKRLKEEGEKILSEIKKIADEEDVHIKQTLVEGSPFETIIDAAQEGGYDLIVMGRHGRTHFERAFMGSVTAKVIGYFKGRILVVPRNASLGWKNILVATDGSKNSDAAFDEALNYAKSYEGTLKIVNAVNVTEEFQAHAPGLTERLINEAKKNLEDVKNRAQQAGINTETFVREGEPYKVIVDLATQLNADTIVMGSHGRTGLTRIFMGSVTARVIGHTPCPVLVVKA